MQRCSTIQVLVLALVALSLTSVCLGNVNGADGQHQMVLESPVDAQARIGEQVLLKCKFKNLRGEPQWCIDDFCLGVSKKESASNTGDSLVLKGRPRHRIIGNKTRGEFHLLIEPVQLQDNMYYYCMATAASEHVKAVKSKKAFITVLTFPQTLHLDSPIHVSLNKPSAIQCSAKQSRPPVKILIAINGQLISDERRYKTEIIRIPIGSGDLTETKYISPSSHIPVDQLRNSFYDTITNITLDDITMKMQGQLVECFAYSFVNNQNQKLSHHKGNHGAVNLNSFQSNVMNTKSVIQVDYAPEVNLKILSNNRILKEEDVISLVCETRATPPIHSYKWYIGKNYLQGVTDFNLNLKLRREMHLQTVTCEASNTVASVKASLQLNIFFKPSFQRGPRSYMLVDKNACNKPLTLDCQVNANPSANVTWYRRRPNKRSVVRTNKYFSIFNFDPSKFSISLSDNDEHSVTDAYEDEWIGEGPTYTIASLNCANFLSNVRNVSNQRHLSPTKGTATRSTPLVKQSKIGRHQRDTAAESRKSRQDGGPESDVLEYEDDVEFDELSGHQGFEFEADKQANENNDFGVYICVAKNRAVDGNNYQSDQIQASKRFIKLNPVGAPIVRALSTSQAQLDEAETRTPTDTDMRIEMTAKVGSSATLTCFIEPVPEFSLVYWVKDGGKIIPNSRYSTTDEFGAGEKNAVYSISSSEESKHRFAFNFKVRYENVTSTSDKTNRPTSSSSPIDGIAAYDSVGVLRSVLYIRNVRKQDLGVYKCKAINLYGSRVASIVLREKTLLDAFNSNSLFSFILVVLVASLVFVAIVLLLVCALSKRIRLILCCCCRCCMGHEKAKEKGLSRNMNIELHSDKTINDWLASSKLSNDTGNGSIINATETTNNTATTILLNNSLDKLQCSSNNSNFKGIVCHYESAGKPLLPLKHDSDPFNEATTISNCKDGDDLSPSDPDDDDDDDENDYDDHNMHYEDDLDEKNELELASFNKCSKRAASKFDKDDFKMDGLNQFSRYLASSALLNPQKEYEYNKMNTSDDESNKKLTITINPAQASTKTLMVPPMMMIRSQNFTNGNFNAKISASGLLPNGSAAANGDTNQKPPNGLGMNYSTDSLRKQAPRLQFQDLNRQVDKSNHQFYESNPIQMNGHPKHGGVMRPEETIDDLAQMLQDSTFRLSDIFSELSPSMNSQSTFNHAKINNFNNNNKPLSGFNGGYHQPSGFSSNAGTLTRTNRASNNDHYIHPAIDSNSKASSTLLRQYQLSATARIQSPQSQASSSPNTQAFSSDHESNYSDNNHTNVNTNNTNTLNNRLLNKFPHPHPFLTSAAVNSSSNSSFNSNENNANKSTTTFVEACFEKNASSLNSSSPSSSTSSASAAAYPFAKIITTSSINGTNKYQTVV